ncbi:hypothetical protein [Alicyclobacillus fastidiosus]|uniref:YHYH domain-containing protein n=1 Tax=Alicyclobacillus fastidiosus TaxID=392011 RepID=A0ABV5AM02_9BACL
MELFKSKRSRWGIGLVTSLTLTVFAPIVAHAYTYTYAVNLGPYGWSINTSNPYKTLHSFHDTGNTSGANDHVHFWGYQETSSNPSASNPQIIYALANENLSASSPPSIEIDGSYYSDVPNDAIGGDYWSVQPGYYDFIVDDGGTAPSTGSTYLSYDAEN